MNITSINTLIEALKTGQPINRVFLAASGGGKKDKGIDMVIKLCRENRVAYQIVPQQSINRKTGETNKKVFAEVAPIAFLELQEVLQTINTGLILILDGIEDTGNLGAIIRSAVAAQVDALLIPKRGSAPINETVLKTSAGTLLNARIVQSGNLSNDIRTLKENNFWVSSTVMDKEKSIPYYDYDFKGRHAVLMGNEHKGVSPLLKKNSDQLIYIPHAPTVQSLNVSAAASVILFEALRQKAAKH